MIKLKFLHACEQVIVSQAGSFSVINIFNEVDTNGLPAINPKFVIISSIIGPVGIYDQTIEIISPDGKPIAYSNGKSDIKGSGGNNFVANFINLAFPLEGAYWIKVTVDGNILTNKDEHYILVKKK